MKTLVTGSAGFIGKHVTERLLARGDQVIGLDNFNEYYDPALKRARIQDIGDHQHFHLVEGDLSDRHTVAHLFETHKPDQVIHLGAQAGVRWSIDHPYDYADSNLCGTLTILEGCRHHNIKHLVLASSSSVYGLNRQWPYSEEQSVDHAVSLYAATKKILGGYGA